MSPVLSESDLRTLRGIQADNFPHRATLQALTEGPPLPDGGHSVTWQAYAVNVPCRVSPISGTDLPRGLVLTPETNFRLALPYGQEVAEKDRAVITGFTNGVQWTMTIGFTFIDTPKAFQSETLCYGTDKVEQVD
jgi:hypothetical protein